MSKFNETSAQSCTENKAGGQAYSESPELALVSILLTSFAQDQFYRSESKTFKELTDLLKQVDPVFAAKAAIFARTKFGMRSITHVLAAELAEHLSKNKVAKSFYKQIIKRPDDITEILAYYLAKCSEKLPNALRRGFAQAFDKFDGYQLAKYQQKDKKVSLVDAVNLVHPTPTEKNKIALEQLVKGTLKNTQTWESKLSDAGQKAASETEKKELKEKAWSDLLSENKLGYFALLRNLRNIIETKNDELLDLAILRLINKDAIHKSLVLPFRFQTAYDELININCPQKLMNALDTAINISFDNVPVFDGKTLVALDMSGSMQGQPMKIGSMFAAVLLKKNENADLLMFSTDAKYVCLNRNDSLFTLTQSIQRNCNYCGTDFRQIFIAANKPYNRIIILSDMQSWVDYYTPKDAFNQYKRTHNCDPVVYSFDLQGYGSLQFPERNVYCLTGFSEKIFSIMDLLEQDKSALINKINEILL